ncbi:hypothetical protein [Pedobacter psychroterrae]|uniref:Uncharacterized protein n=1 Tax=Pedobacter psychroterrae TaxID=2530453 RepID=A0A4R0NNA9_9SPHI|nr:hypothetical protein [Pedobacter psychroterrae]TCD01123.1 hypothetical protein EZ437_10160 [Pedobacter psychroterrae]
MYHCTMMLKKQFLLFLLIGVFSLHLAHQLLPHHHHQEEVVAAHSHGAGTKHHHHHEDSGTEKQDQQQNWLDELLSFIHHGQTDNPVQSGSQLKADFCKVITIIPSVFDYLPEFSIPDYQLILPGYAPPEQQSTEHVILFKSRRGPPEIA